MSTSFLIVYPPTSARGLRHVVVQGKADTLCGRNPDWWFWERFSETIGCKTCARLAATPDPQSKERP